ncbi:uncharacterized protein LOC771474 [Gallus gallus]|uniref:uncharacterized protein LOC771474 n=1 Tax=Gallus gallus TaxID=9031 RepID=UPI001F00225F|nr:uncharacterized protein LOC771474 [Gallus gallus]XP_046761079.1 uncharacterized protein LOC771474 [Gallus gallus]
MLNTPREIIQYILDKLKVALLTNEGLAAAIVAAVGPQQQRSLQQQGSCFRCGQYGHVRAQCPSGEGQSGPPDLWRLGLARYPKKPPWWPHYLGKLMMLAPSHMGWLNISRSSHLHRRRRDVSLGHECNDEVKLWSVTSCIFASIFAPGVLAAAALSQIERLVCWSAKQANMTTLVLNAMLEDLNSVRHALLQNRAAIDFLLLAHGHGCEDTDGMCCFILSDHSVSIHKQLQWMQEHTQKIKEESDPLESWLDRLFGGMGLWLKQLLKVLAIGLAIFVCILICLPCFVGCLQNCLQRMMEKTFDQQMEYHRLREKL